MLAPFKLREFDTKDNIGFSIQQLQSNPASEVQHLHWRGRRRLWHFLLKVSFLGVLVKDAWTRNFSIFLHKIIYHSLNLIFVVKIPKGKEEREKGMDSGLGLGSFCIPSG